MVDDHAILRLSLARQINGFDECIVTMQANNGSEFISNLALNEPPDVVLLDLNMPVMDGYETAVHLKEHFPKIKVLMLTMFDSELILIRLLQANVKGFLKKDIEPSELKFAIHSVMKSDFYYSSHTIGRLANLLRSSNAKDSVQLKNATLNDQEVCFLKLASTDLTYKEIAQRMNLTPRMVDALRDQLFLKMNVKSRVGLAMVAIRNGIVNLN